MVPNSSQIDTKCEDGALVWKLEWRERRVLLVQIDGHVRAQDSGLAFQRLERAVGNQMRGRDTPMETPTQIALVFATQAGDRTAFETLVKL